MIKVDWLVGWLVLACEKCTETFYLKGNSTLSQL